MQFFFNKDSLSFYIEGMHYPIPTGSIPVSEELFSSIRGEIAEGRVLGVSPEGTPFTSAPPPKPVSMDALLRGYASEHFDKTAQGLGYDDSSSLFRRVFTPNSDFHDEAVSFSEWVDQCWSVTFATIKDLRKTRGSAPSKEDFLATFPEYISPSSEPLLSPDPAP